EARIPETAFALAETGAGFGDVYLSPLHGALIASTIANGGIWKDPILFEPLPPLPGAVAETDAPAQDALPVAGAAAALASSGTSAAETVAGRCRRSGPPGSPRSSPPPSPPPSHRPAAAHCRGFVHPDRRRGGADRPAQRLRIGRGFRGGWRGGRAHHGCRACRGARRDARGHRHEGDRPPGVRRARLPGGGGGGQDREARR